MSFEPTPAPVTTDATADAIITETVGQVDTDNSTTEADIDQSVVRKKLERKLSLRPEKQDLVDKNILKDSNVAPSLQAAQAELQRSQLEDKLDYALQHRPKPEELVKGGILKEDEALVSP
ncbi:hypothetical protein M422DRAFT_27850 [Sphaerobolus stellatus SS14]|nr:hypothetical protein M422DRAFT_27850 [Sphaerobolus stellatus SS14]